MKEQLEPTIANLNFARQNPGQYTFNEEQLRSVIIQDNDFKNSFYNKEIKVNIHTDGVVGHVSADLPCYQFDGSIKIEKFIGLELKYDGEYKLFGYETVFSSSKHSTATRELLSTSIPVTEETYSKLATMVTDRKNNPGVDYAVHGLSNNNCIQYMDHMLKDAGIVDGLLNKFNYEDYTKLDWKAVKFQANYLFDEYAITNTVNNSEQPFVSHFESLLSSRYTNLKQKSIESQLNSDINLFLSIESTSTEARAQIMNFNLEEPSHDTPQYFDFVGAQIFDKFPEAYGLSLIKKEGDQLVYQLNTDSPLNLSPGQVTNIDFNDPKVAEQISNMIVNHLSVENFNVGTLSETSQSLPVDVTKAKSNNIRSIITKVEVGAVGGSIATGLIFHIAEGGTVGVGALNSGGGWIVSIGVDFGPKFFATLGWSLAIGAVIFAVTFVTQYFIQRHQKQIQKHLRKDIKKTNADIELVTDELTQLFESLNTQTEGTLDAIIAQTNSVICLLQNKISDIEKRGRYAYNHKQKAAGKSYLDAGHELRDQESNLVDIEKQLKFKKTYEEFIIKHNDANTEDLITLAEKTVLKKFYDPADIAKIEALRILIFQEALDLVSHGDLITAEKLLKKTSALTYFPAGDFSLLETQKPQSSSLDSLAACGALTGSNKQLNELINSVNNKISRGHDPREIFTEIDSYIIIITSLIKGIDGKKYAKNIETISTEFNTWLNSYNEQKQQFLNGNPPKTLELGTMLETMRQIGNIHYDTPNDWLNFLQSNQINENDKKNPDEAEKKLINTAYSSWKIINFILIESASGEFDSALSIAQQFKEISSDYAETADKYISVLNYLKESPTEDVNFWLGELDRCTKVVSDKRSEGENLTLAIIPRFMTNCIFKQVSELNFAEAEKVLQQWQDKDTEQTPIIVIIRQQIKFGQDNLEQDDSFWLNELKPISQGSSESEEEKNNQALGDSFRQAIVLTMLNKSVSEHAKLGFYGKASEVLKGMTEKIPNPNSTKTIKDFDFQHNGQMLNTFLQPLEAMIHREVAMMNPSIYKTCTQFSLGCINAAQVLVPNILPLGIQGMHAHYVSDTQIFFENIYNARDNAINIFKAPFVGFAQPENGLRAPTMFEVGLVYSRLGLIAFNALDPVFERCLADSQLAQYDQARGNILYYWNIGNNLGFVYDNINQLMQNAPGHVQTNNNIFALVRLVINGGLQIMHGHLAKSGVDFESMSWYRAESGANSLLSSAGVVLFINAITGGFGILAGAATFVSFINLAHEQFSQSGNKTFALNSLAAIINNIETVVKEYSNDFTGIQSNLLSLENILKNSFSGLSYNSSDPDLVNSARAVHFHYSTASLGFTHMLAKTDVAASSQDPALISETYRLPGFMVIRTIMATRLAKICQFQLENFRDEYQKFSDIIYRSTPVHWRRRNLKNLLDTFNEILKLAFGHYVVAAHNEPNIKKKEEYLDRILLNYNYSKEWSAILDNDKKFYTAFIYYSIGKKDKAEKILNKFYENELKDLLMKGKGSAIPQDAIVLLGDVNKDLQYDILTNRAQFNISDSHIVNAVEKKMREGKFEDAKDILEHASNINGRSTLETRIFFAQTNGLNPVEALRMLDSEENRRYESNRNFNFWSLLYSIISRLYVSIKYARSDKIAKFYLGLKKLALDRLLSFEEISSEYRLVISKEHQEITLQLTQVLGQNYEVFVEEGHKCLRGETRQTLYEHILDNLLDSALFDCSNDRAEAFMPIETPADGECAFSCFGLKRKDAIKQVYRDLKYNHEDETVFNIILKDLENQKILCENKSVALDQMTKYLDKCNKKGIYIDYTDNSCGILDAIAYIQRKNLRIFRLNPDANLVAVTHHVNNPDFETINILHTNASGKIRNLSSLNHFVKLEAITFRVRNAPSAHVAFTSSSTNAQVTRCRDKSKSALVNRYSNRLNMLKADIDRPYIPALKK